MVALSIVTVPLVCAVQDTLVNFVKKRLIIVITTTVGDMEHA